MFQAGVHFVPANQREHLVLFLPTAALSARRTLYTGCNVENASFGATNCAERTAIFKAVSEGRRSFESIAIAAGPSAPWPCGICRQVMNEFSPGMRVMVTWDGGYDAMPLSDLLPHGFGPESLDK